MLHRDDTSCPIVSTMKQVIQGSIISQRMTINSILIHIMEIVDHNLAAVRRAKTHLADRIKQNL